jgi:hypothetical protein
VSTGLVCRASQLRGVVAELRKVCAYPTLLSDFSMAGSSGEGNGGDGDSPTGSPRAASGAPMAAGADREGDGKPVDLVAASGKLRVLQQLLPALQAKGHRVLLLSQSRKVTPVVSCGTLQHAAGLLVIRPFTCRAALQTGHISPDDSKGRRRQHTLVFCLAGAGYY